MQNPDTFIRFQAIGRIADAGIEIIPQLVASIMDSNHRQFNRDIMECIHYYLTRNQITEKEAVYLQPLLKARDAEVRTIIAQSMGWWEFKNCENILLEILGNDKNGQVKRFALASLLSLKSTKAIPLVKELVFTEECEDVRRLGCVFLGRMDKVNSIEILLKVLDNDKSAPVRIAAAESFTNFRDERALEPLRRAAKSEDYYLRRAAAKGLAVLYQIEAIEILIDSMSFLSIDTGNNYGYNVPNFIAAYVGFDFPESERYDRQKWMQWFKENKDKIDIKKNVNSYLGFSELATLSQNRPPEEKIQKYEEFLVKFPDYKQAKETLANLLNQVAWDMVTADKTTSSYNPHKGLKYARRAVELNPIPMIVDTLVEAYYVNGQMDEAIKICEDELKKNPNEQMFKERLEKYLKEKEEK